MRTLAQYPMPSTQLQEPEAELYVAFPGGCGNEKAGVEPTDEYIVPAQYIRYGASHAQAGKIRKAGRYIMVKLWAAPPYHRHNWTQWIHIDQELFLDEVQKG